MKHNKEKILAVMNDKEYLKELGCIPCDILTALKKANVEVKEVSDILSNEYFEDAYIKLNGFNNDGELFDFNYGSLNGTVLNHAHPVLNRRSISVYADNISNNTAQEMFDLDFTEDVIPSEIREKYLKQHFGEIVCTAYNIRGDYKEFAEPLLQYSGEKIGTAIFMKGNDKLEIVEEVVGDVRIIYKGEIYKNVGQFPDELIDIIKNGELWEHPEVDVINNNWIEDFVYINGEFIDGEVSESDLSSLTPQELVGELTDLAELFFNEYCKTPETEIDNDIERE